MSQVSRFAVPLLLLLPALLAGGCSVPSLLIRPVSSSPELQEVVVDRGETRREKVAVIPVEGMLLNARTGGGLLGAQENKVSLFRQQLDRAAGDDRVKAVVLRINSPGGTVSASQAMYDMVVDFQKRTGKPVVAHCQDVAASGGYYVAVAADEIHALDTSIVGSIGVIFQTIDVSEMLDKVGVAVRPITSGPLKDMGSPFDGLDDGERLVIEAMVDELHDGFTTVVERHRSVADPGQAFDGRIFTGRGATQAGLVDAVMPLDRSIARAAELAGIESPRVVMYHRPFGYQGTIYASSPASPVTTDARDLRLAVPGLARLAELMQPGAYYLWMP
jgi:protease-4